METVAETKTAWLLERQGVGGSMYMRVDSAGGLEWTPDADRALKFADERSARQFLHFSGPLLCNYVITEHMFYAE